VKLNLNITDSINQLRGSEVEHMVLHRSVESTDR
jgi:hypothetical protein